MTIKYKKNFLKQEFQLHQNKMHKVRMTTHLSIALMNFDTLEELHSHALVPEKFKGEDNHPDAAFINSRILSALDGASLTINIYYLTFRNVKMKTCETSLKQ